MIEGTLRIKRPVGRPPAIGPEIPVVDPYREFVSGFLSGGPIVRNNVYREAQDRQLEWDKVVDAFHALNGVEYNQKGEFIWKLIPS